MLYNPCKLFFKVEDLIFNFYVMEGKLTKPVFVKVNEIEKTRDGYNVYVRVISAEQSTNENQTFSMVRAVVGD